MLFPVPAIWSRKPIEDPNDRIDRLLFNRSQRLMAGLAVSDDFRRIDGVLAVTAGHGKYLRLSHSAALSTEVPEAIANHCRLAAGGNCSLDQFTSAISDLAGIQASLVDQIKIQAGKYVDRVMAVAVVDPGIWLSDFDGRPTYVSFCHPARLAELSGLTVIDAFPDRDIAAGGKGTPIDAIPLWLMLADRNQKVARKNQAILLADSCRGYWLPASDGLDAELPLIIQLELNGFKFIHSLCQRTRELAAKDNSRRSNRPPLNFETHYCNGRSDQALLSSFQAVLARNGSEHSGDEQKDDELWKLATSFLEAHPDQLSTLIRTSIVVVLDDLVDRLSPLGELHGISISAPEQLGPCIINRLNQRLPDIDVSSVLPGAGARCQPAAVVAAIMGLLYIDQMPANIPWLTGADSQRILGRLTPGRPGSWRQLIRSMADFHPPAMKLKDAV